MSRAPLPIDAVLPEILAALDREGAVALTAPPGSGKTTRVPTAIVDHGITGEVVVLQPRRLAARAAARRVAVERGCELGGEVGYQVRHDRKTSARTRVRFVTEGILARNLVKDPFLPGVGAVVLDEFHERSLEADLTLGMLAEVRHTVREDLKIVVMSATLDAAPIARFLDPCGEVRADGRLHDVETRYLPAPSKKATLDPDTIRAAVFSALDGTTGDVLVFLPGVGEIRRCVDVLEPALGRREVSVLPLHGQLSAEEQDAAIQPGPRRKTVLATNVAETSVTIEGVTAVVDTGFARILRHDSGRGLDRLELQRISRASAEQRRGRAGRTGPGLCIRLWSPAEERGMPEFERPEIRRLDLTGLALQVYAFAARPPREFEWFEAPDPSALDLADDLLTLLGAVSGSTLTEVGRAMLRHPLHPRLARMVEEGRIRGCGRAAAEFAALLSERDLVSRRERRGDRPADLFSARALFHEIEDARFAPAAARRLGVDARAARAVARARDQILGGAPPKGRPDWGNRDGGDPNGGDRDGGNRDEDAAWVQTLLAGYPDRVSRRADETTTEGVMATGRGCRLTMTDHENLGALFLSLQVRDSGDRQQNRSLVDLAVPLVESWLEDVFPGSIRQVDELELHRERGSVVTLRRRMFGRLILDERRGGRPDPEELEALFAAELRRDPWRYLGEQVSLRSFLSRLEWLRGVRPDLELPEIGDAEVGAAAAALCAGLTRLTDIARAPVFDMVVRGLPRDLQARVREEAPERIELPTGRSARIDYSGPEPFVAARLQEFFGLTKTPSLAAGRVSLLLHLLAPNHRPVQITRDLPSFWANVYPSVRAELKRRYPKHAWPGDPIAARPESKPRRRR